MTLCILDLIVDLRLFNLRAVGGGVAFGTLVVVICCDETALCVAASVDTEIRSGFVR